MQTSPVTTGVETGSGPGLDRGERSIADVALECGFNSPQYMYLVFKRELGCTPRAYRDRVCNEEDGWTLRG